MPQSPNPSPLFRTAAQRPPLLAWSAPALAVLGAACAPWQFNAALALFALAGIALVLAAPRGGGALAAGPASPAGGDPRLEAATVLALAVFSLLIRLYRLDRYPAGPGFVESVMSLDAGMLAQAPYTPHVREPQAPFPSLLFYQGLAAARWLGWSVRSFRVPAALWGALSVLSFYALLRQICSRFSAALFAVLFSVNNLHLTLSRLFFPGTILLFSATATAVFLVKALRTRDTTAFVLAGLCCGLGMHGYLPGRVLLPAFFAWLVYLHWGGGAGSRMRPDIRALAVFAAAGLLVAGPVIWWGLRNPDIFAAPVIQNTPQGLLAGLSGCLGRLPAYVRMFYTQADGILEPTDGLALFPLLRPDWLTQVFLPLGLVAALAAFWEPVPSLLLGGLVLGILPAVLATNYPAPCTRRALLALPWAYALAAWGWDRCMAALRWDAAPALVRRTLAGLALTLGCLAVALSLRQYFVEIMERPSVRSSYNVAASLVGAEAARYSGANTMVSYDLLEPRTSALIMVKDTAWRKPRSVQNFTVQDWPGGRDPEGIKQFEDFLVYKAPGPRLLLMAPYLMSSVPLLLSLFPEGRPAVFHEVRDFNSGMPPWDPYEPFVHLVRFAVSQQDAAAFTGVVDLTQAPYAPGGRVDAFAPGFAAARASRRLDLGAVYVAEQQGEGLTFRMAWKGWSLRVDGRPVAWGQRLAMDAGAHALELEGRVPASAKGPLPLGVSADDDPDPLHGRLIPLDIRYGLLATLSPSGGMAQGRPLTRFEPLPLHRFAQPEGIREPFGAALESGLAVPMDGTYEFRVRLPFHGRVLVGGQTAFDSMPGGQAYPKPIRLSAGRPLPLRVECALDGMPDHERTLVVDVLGPRDEDWKALPWNWCLSGLGAGQIRNRGSRAAAP